MAYFILKSYKPDRFQPLNSHETLYFLTCEKFYFFGMIKKEVIIPYGIPDHANSLSWFKKWDGMIEKQEKFKL